MAGAKRSVSSVLSWLAYWLLLTWLCLSQPDLFNKLITNETKSARRAASQKEDELRLVKQLDEYTLEVATVYTMCSLYHASSKSTLVKEATFIDSVAQTIEFHYKVSGSRKKSMGEKARSGR